jgi:GntR family transcriptional regulator
MQIHIATNSGVPVYLQIIDQVKRLVACGRLLPGEAVPPIRALAQQLLINPNTVARAYRELEAQGVLRSKQGSGTVVATGPSPLSQRERERLVNEKLDALLTEAAHVGISFERVIAMLRNRQAEMKQSEREREGA